VETLGLTSVAVDPVIAAITGQTSGVQAIYRVNWIPSGQVSLRRSFRQASVSFDYNHGVNPGNGVFLTSRYESASASLSYTGVRRWNLGISGTYSTLGSLAQDLAKYGSYTAGAGASTKLTGALHFISRFDYRYYDLSNTPFGRNSYRASIGFGFSPGDVPLSLW
jgi:hypothetical protein